MAAVHSELISSPTPKPPLSPEIFAGNFRRKLFQNVDDLILHVIKGTTIKIVTVAEMYMWLWQK
jgi:hypothetical protein